MQDISGFCLFMTDLCIQFYNLASIQLQVVSSSGKKSKKAASEFVTPVILYLFFMEYFINDKTGKILTTLLEDRFD